MSFSLHEGNSAGRFRTHVLNGETSLDSFPRDDPYFYAFDLVRDTEEGVRRARFDTFPVGLASELVESVSEPFAARRELEIFRSGRSLAESLLASDQVVGGEGRERQGTSMKVSEEAAESDVVRQDRVAKSCRDYQSVLRGRCANVTQTTTRECRTHEVTSKRLMRRRLPLFGTASALCLTTLRRFFCLVSYLFVSSFVTAGPPSFLRLGDCTAVAGSLETLSLHDGSWEGASEVVIASSFVGIGGAVSSSVPLLPSSNAPISSSSGIASGPSETRAGGRGSKVSMRMVESAVALSCENSGQGTKMQGSISNW